MDDLQRRFATLESVDVPDLWPVVQSRAQAFSGADSPVPVRIVAPAVPSRSRRSWVAVALAALLVVALVAGALMVGSRLVEQPHVSPVPSATAVPSPSQPPPPTASPTAQPAQAPPGPGQFIPGGSLVDARARHVAVLLRDGRVLVAGGAAPPRAYRPGFFEKYLDSVELWDPASGSFSPTGSLRHSPLALDRVEMSAFTLGDGRVLIVPAGCACRPLPAQPAELWDPASETASSLDALQIARGSHTVTQLTNDRILIAGGKPTLVDPETAAAEIWDLAANAVVPTGSLVYARYYAASTPLADGRALIVGGYTDQEGPAYPAARPPEVWDPATGSFSLVPELDSVRSAGDGPLTRFNAVTLSDGRVLILDGARARVWDPTARSLIDGGAFIEARYGYTATVLADGRVLVLGGFPQAEIDGVPPSLTSSELWDPARGAFVQGASLDYGRSSHTATLLPDGRVLVVGGLATSGFDPRRAAEIWDPDGAP